MNHLLIALASKKTPPQKVDQHHAKSRQQDNFDKNQLIFYSARHLVLVYNQNHENVEHLLTYAGRVLLPNLIHPRINKSAEQYAVRVASAYPPMIHFFLQF